MRISVECGGFDDAADACRTANQTAALLTESLAGKLAGFGGMAGNDASSADFASSYDAAAREAVGSLVDLTHAFVGVGRLLTATGTNHASAEAAAADHVAAYTGLGLTGDTYARVQAAPLPSSLGAQEPSLSVVDRFILDHIEGFVWPGADVSLLREAAHAWRRASSAVAPLVDHVDIATTMIERQRSPEIPTALAALADLRSLVVDTAVELEAVGVACEDYAAAVDDTHDRTRALLAEVAGMLVEGAAVSVIIGGLTGGLGASASAAAAAARIRAQAPRFHALLVGLRATVAAAGSRLRTAQDTLRDLRERLDRYAKLGVRDERGGMLLPGGWGFSRAPGWLRVHETPPGHVLSRHVGKTTDELAERCRTTGIKRASSFSTEKDAERLIAEVLDKRSADIRQWLRSGGDTKLELDHIFPGPTGVTVDAAGRATPADSVRVVLIPSDRIAGGWQILTAFPR